MFGIGETELAIILLFAFLIFGPDKLPGMGRTIGRALRQFRNAQEGFTKVVQTEVIDPATEAMSDTPKKPNRSRDEELDADLDDDKDGSSAPSKHKETFAERKARLEAQKKAAEAPVVVEAAAAGDDADSDADADADAAARPAGQAGHPAATRRPAEKPKAPTSAAELYAMKPKKKAEEPKAEEPESVEAEPVSAADSAPAAEPAPAADTTGKEDGSEEA